MASNEEIKILITAEDKASGVLSKFSGKINDMQGAFKGMAFAGTAAFSAIAAVVGTGINNAIEAEKSNRQLEHSIIDISKGTKDQVDQIKALSMALQKKVGIDDDSLNRGAAQLATFGLQSKSVVALTKSLADFTINQDGLNASSEQYIGNANIMAKALNGQFGILEKMGIRFTDSQQEIIKFGTEEQKVAAITEGFNQNLRETSDTIGGSAEANMAKLRRSIGEITEQIGTKFIPILQQILDKVQPIIDKVLEWTQAHPELTTHLIIVAAAVSALVAALGFLGLALPVVITGFTLLTGPIGLTVLALAAVAAATIYLIKNWDTLSTKAKEIWLSVWNTIKGYIDNIENWINEHLIRPVQNAIQAMSNLAAKVPGSGGLGITNKIGDAISGALGIGGRASGGPVSGGTPYIVGEQGPELFVPGKSGSIIPNGGGYGNMVINITGTFLSEDAAAQLGDMLINQVKRELRI